MHKKIPNLDFCERESDVECPNTCLFKERREKRNIADVYKARTGYRNYDIIEKTYIYKKCLDCTDFFNCI